MLKNTGAVLLTGLTISWVWRGIRTRVLQSGNSPGPVPFEHVISDAHAPVNQWAAGVGDINGDGFVDVVSSGSAPGSGGLYWYEYPTWAKHVIDATGGFSDDLQLVDVDGDGDLDIVVPEDGSKEVRLIREPWASRESCHRSLESSRHR